MTAIDTPVPSVTRIAGVPERELNAFLQRNAEKYRLKWRLLEGSNSVLSWNWAAFFFGPMWLFYRKMWLFGIVFLVVAAIPVLNWVLIPGALVMGLGGNEIYRRHALKRYLESVTLYGTSEAGRLVYLRAKGGVSIAAAVIASVTAVLCVAFLFGVAFLATLGAAVGGS